MDASSQRVSKWSGSEQLFIENTSLYKIIRACMGIDACSMLRDQRSWWEPKDKNMINLSWKIKLTFKEYWLST